MPVNLAPLRDNLFGQLTILLAIVGVVLMIIALLAQNMGRVFGVAVIVIVLAGLMFIFRNLESLGEWFSKIVFRTGYISLGDASMWIQTLNHFIL
ncbi:hypothetical protein [Listeria monocytogenes]|uniref:hypothetical protein n=1 Tax=Listeria monocytogenes TaxID=1639 RepID=UPI0011EB1DA8|nr:hypothetical protein [Listeria monocytogenes]TYV00751.1 hypothetical protein FZ054_15140 [Listeria monocytogenes]